MFVQAPGSLLMNLVILCQCRHQSELKHPHLYTWRPYQHHSYSVKIKGDSECLRPGVFWWKRLGVALANSVYFYLQDSQSSVEELTGWE